MKKNTQKAVGNITTQNLTYKIKKCNNTKFHFTDLFLRTTKVSIHFRIPFTLSGILNQVLFLSGNKVNTSILLSVKHKDKEKVSEIANKSPKNRKINAPGIIVAISPYFNIMRRALTLITITDNK